MNPECIYVQQNSGMTQYSFTVNLDSCGTQFINDFEGEAGQAYLENVLVLQVGVEITKFISLIFHLFHGFYLLPLARKKNHVTENDY